MNSIYILWQDQYSKLWHPVAKLTHENNLYRLNYTKGANSSKNFVPFPNMEKLDSIYESQELFPFFQNRIMPKSRPEFRSIINWLDMTPDTFDPLDYLSVTGGERKTDNYRILKLPDLINGKFVFNFLVSGIHYLEIENQEKIKNLSNNLELDYIYETDNPVDPNAIKLVDKESGTFVGYCPRYLVNDFKKLLDQNPEFSHFKIKKLNINAPASYRMVCSFESLESEHYKPLNFNEYLAHTISHK